jgi:glycosyltransferase involved in cell wall biosynthesis
VKVALVSLEYPYADIPYGGIGTYVKMLSEALVRHGHSVELFCGSRVESASVDLADRLRLHKVFLEDRQINQFCHRVLEPFAARQAAVDFDVVEGAEYNHDTSVIRQKFPDLPLVIKLHSPSYVLAEFNRPGWRSLPLTSRARRLLGMVRAAINRRVRPHEVFKGDQEYQLARAADLVCSPSQILVDRVRKDWRLKRVALLPNVYTPPAEILSIEPGPSDQARPVISFVGTLHHRKGVASFLQVIPRVIRHRPDAIFRFVGKDIYNAAYGATVREYFQRNLPGYVDHCEFTGSVALDRIPDYLARTDVCVFPALWDNFPYVCLEAMSAGKAVIASDNSGMREIIRNGENGFLVRPRDARAMARLILQIIGGRVDTRAMGRAARRTIAEEYGDARIVPAVAKAYEEAMRTHR